MDLKKAFSFEHLFSSLSFKRRVLSGFVVGVLVSVFLFSLFSFNSPATTSSSSAFSWFFSIPNAITHSTTAHNSSISSDLVTTNGTYLTTNANNSKSTSNLEAGNPSKSVLDKNSTLEVKNSSSLVHQEPILNSTGVREEQIIVENKLHLENNSKDDGMQKVIGKKDNVQVNVSSVTNDTVTVSNELEKVNKKCNIFDGKWVRDDRKGFYPGGSCPYIDNDFNCYKNGRPDEDFLRWRWQPNHCDIPRMNATDFLTKLKDKRLLFVGDSLNRNMWESLVCILRQSVKVKKNVYEASGRHEFKTRGYYSIRFKDYNCSVDFVQSPFLVREINFKNANGSDDERLRLDLLDETTVAYRTADVIVFNTGHWWTHEKTSRGVDYYQEGDNVYPLLKVLEAYKKALTTWARWVDKNINPSRTEVIFRGYSLTHFKGGQWNSGGQCHKETEPIFNEKFLSKHPSKMRALERILESMKTPVIYLNVSRLTDYRKDGHPSIYRKIYKTVEEQAAAETSQDCSHWCLPGIPDTWNELLYASLLINGKGSWNH